MMKQEYIDVEKRVDLIDRMRHQPPFKPYFTVVANHVVDQVSDQMWLVVDRVVNELLFGELG